MDLKPFDVRTEGCAYQVYRFSPQWDDFERTLAVADLGFVPSTIRQDLRFGLVLSDRLGIVREIHTNDLDWPNGRMPGISQRQRVEISASFVAAPRAFVGRHPDLMIPSRHCPGGPRDRQRRSKGDRPKRQVPGRFRPGTRETALTPSTPL
jgi:hypothetical protein